MIDIGFSDDNARSFVSAQEIESQQLKVDCLHTELKGRAEEGGQYLGWLHLPSRTSTLLLNSIISTKSQIVNKCNTLVCIGIGGSYLGAKAAISFLNSSFGNLDGPDIYFAGHNMCSDYHADLLRLLEDRDVCINVTSKSGTTIESAIAFRLLRNFMEKKYGKEETRKRIVVITDFQKSGLLHSLAQEEGYKLFEIPKDIGGRFSVLTTVGLLPIAIAGIDIRALIEGALLAENVFTKSSDLSKNIAYLYAANRYLLFQKGKVIELMATFNQFIKIYFRMVEATCR